MMPLMKNKRYYQVFINSILVAFLIFISSVPAHSQQTSDLCKSSSSNVCLGNQYLFTIKAQAGEYTFEERSEIIAKRIESISNDYSIEVDSIQIEEPSGTGTINHIMIMADDQIIVTVTDADAIKAGKLDKKLLATKWLKKIKRSVRMYRRQQRAKRILYRRQQRAKRILYRRQQRAKRILYILCILFIAIIIATTLKAIYCIVKSVLKNIDQQQWLNCITFRTRECINLRIINFVKSVNNINQKQWRQDIIVKFIKKINLQQWLNCLEQLEEKICDFFSGLFGKVLELLIVCIILILLMRLVVEFFNSHFDLTTDNVLINSDLEKLNTHIVTLLNIIGLLLLFGVLYILLNWLSRSRGGTVVLPFEDKTVSSKNANNEVEKKSNLGKAVADSLVVELHRISDIHNKLTQTIRTGEDIESQRKFEGYNFPPLTPIQENIERNLIEVGSFEVGKNTFSIGRIVLILKWLWPFGGVRRVITGSIQTYNSTIRLIAQLEYQYKIQAWDVIWENDQRESMTVKIKDLAYKVAMGLNPTITAKTWQSFKYFTEAICSYDQYQKTGLSNYLYSADENCQKAHQVEKKYQNIAELFYKIGIAYLKEKKYDNAERAFRSSLEIKPTNEYSYTGLGNVYYEKKKFEDAKNQYEHAKMLEKDFPYPENGLGNIYFQRGDYNTALTFYESACEKEKYWRYPFWKPYHNRGLIYLYRKDNFREDNFKDYDEADKNFNKAIQVNKSLKDSQELHSAYNGLALAYLFKGINRFFSMEALLVFKCTWYFKLQNNLFGEAEKLDLRLSLADYILYGTSEIKQNLEKARENINKAADIALETQPYIYWNIGIITLAEYKLAESKLAEADVNKEVCNAWEKAIEIASRKSDKLCIEIYKYAINAFQKIENPAYKCALHSLNKEWLKNPLNKGWLKIMLKDIKIISTLLDNNNQYIEKLVSEISSILSNNILEK
jgi:tetratricopeptide (TPR) repeat protein